MCEHQLPDPDFELVEQIHDEELVEVLSHQLHLLQERILGNGVTWLTTLTE